MLSQEDMLEKIIGSSGAQQRKYLELSILID